MPEKRRPREHPAHRQLRVTPERVREMQHRCKKELLWSTSKMARELGYSRAHIKGVETGKKPITDKFANAFRKLEATLRWLARDAEQEPETTIISRFSLPPRFEILARPRRCDRCHQFFVPAQPNQKRHARGQCP